jgi:hypothetical protein
MTANYNKSEFTLGPALSPSSDKTYLIDSGELPPKVSKAEIAGIVVGCVAAVGLIALAIWFWWRRRKSQGVATQEPKKSSTNTPFLDTKAALDGTAEKPGDEVRQTELGPEGEVMEMEHAHKLPEADHMNVLFELPG